MTIAVATAESETVYRTGVLGRSTAALVPYAPSILRVVVGFVFLVYGYNKLQDPAGFEQMLTGLAFPAPAILSWFVTLLEVIGGAALMVGCSFARSPCSSRSR